MKKSAINWKHAVCRAVCALPVVLSLVAVPPCVATGGQPDLQLAGAMTAKSLPELEQVVKESPDAELRYAAVREIASRGGTGTDVLIQALDDRSPGVRYGAAQSLGERGDAMTDKALALLKEKDYKHRVMGVVMLKHIGTNAAPEKVVPALVASLEDEHFDVRMNAANALAVHGRNAVSAVPSLLKAASDDEWWVRREVYFALAAIDTPESRQALIDLATSERHSVLGWKDHRSFMAKVYADPKLQDQLALAFGQWLLKEEGYINTFAARGKLINGLKGLEQQVKEKKSIPPDVADEIRLVLKDETKAVWSISEKDRERLEAILEYMNDAKGDEQ